jgi:hypothetical protein
MKEINKVIHDERTYIESIGKQDKETVRGALAEHGAESVLRICFGMTGNALPIRALGYYASALAVHELYFPKAELQFVYPNRAAYMANSVKLSDATTHANTVDTEARRLFARRFRADHGEAGRVMSFFDFETPNDDLVAEVAAFLNTQPDMQEAFTSKAQGGNYAYYLAAHLLMHDTNPALRSCNSNYSGALEKSDIGRVISIGAQSERPFYLARMACKKAQIVPGGESVETGQIFTRHIIPPYIACREGEPVLGNISSPQDIPTTHAVRSVQRDLRYLRQRIHAEQQFGDAAIQSDLVGPEIRPDPLLDMTEVRYA